MGSYNYYKMFGCFNRKFKISESEPPPDVREAFWRYTDGGERMTSEQLLHFMVEHQRENTCTSDDVEAIMQTVFHRRHHTDRRRYFSLEDFFYYLFRDDLNGPINTEQVHHDMTAPLQHYFIYTGHNSYLTGNQLSSDCSEIPIIRSLENGVRGIELDLWPNSTKDNVHVLHGRTLTTPVPLIKCLKSIKEHAFVKSPYPVIITLEDHLTSELQAKVAEMVTDIFGDMLYCPQGGLEEFPSPTDLQHKIILSTKPPKEYLGTNINKEGEPSSPKDKDSSDDEPEVEVEDETEVEAEVEAEIEAEVETDDIEISSSSSSSDDEDVQYSNKEPGTAPRYKRLIAKKKCPRNLEEFPSPEDLQNEIILSPKSPNNKDVESSSPKGKDSSDDEFGAEADDIKNNQRASDDEDNENSSNKKPSTAPRYKRLIAINAGSAKKKCPGNLEEFPSPEDSPNEITPSPKSPKECLETNNKDGEFSSPKEKESPGDETGAEADDIKRASDGEDSENSNKTKPSTAPRYKRLIAINAGSAKKKCPGNFEEFPSPEDSPNEITPSPKSPKDGECLETNNNKDGEFSSPKEKESPGDETGADDIKRDSDDEDSENSNKKPGAVPRYKRLIAINAGTANKKCSTNLEEFPSPKDLQSETIISPKSPKEHLETNDNKDGESSSPKEKDSSDSSSDDVKSDSDDEDSDNFNKRSGGAPQYKRLIAIHAGNAKKKCLRQVLKILGNSAVRLSLSEQELQKAAALHATDLVSFTQKNILRVYPKGTRVTSSNFRPVTGWIHGAQMVAFNMQGYGKSLWMMHGLFRLNGGCGYVKKPDVLIKKGRSSEVFDPKLPWPVRKTLKVIVYMGDGWRLDFSHTHFDTFSPPDFYTKIYIEGVPTDDAKTKTKVIEDEWAPYWDQEFSFPLRIPELALLRIEVREYDRSDKDDFGGQTCLPVSELRSGIRAVPLYDKRGKKFKSVRLLMQFQFE